MSGSAEVWLAIIAIAVTVMALIQVGAIIAGLRMARRVDQIATELETNVKPLLANLTAMSAEASRAATVASAQIDRLDRVFGDLTLRVDRTLTAAQSLVSGPAREGMAIVAGVRAAVGAIKGFHEAARRRRASRPITFEEDEESLFIG